jgi:iron donor protein CyaY
MLTESEFRKVADEELKALAKLLDPSTELTVDVANDALTIEFDDGDKFVLNEQGPTRQLWFAASFQAAHFDFDASSRTWKDDKTGEQLRVRVARDIGKKLGKPVSL